MNSLRLGDCIAGMNSLEPGSVDLAFADPPFNIGYDYDVYNDRQERDAYLKWSREWISAVYRVLKSDGTFWLAIGDEYAAELKLASQETGFHSRSWVIWYYTFGVNCKNKFTRSHAHLFYFVKDRDNFTFKLDVDNRIPSARQLVYNDARGNHDGRLPDDTWFLRPQDLMDGFGANEDTWYLPRVAGTFKERAGFHGCQMPEQLLGRIIRACSKPNELVLDPFSGSATTLAVAKKLSRRYIGFDLSPEYVQRGTSRLDAIRVGDRLDGDAEPLMTAPKTLVHTPAGDKKKKSKHAKKLNSVFAKAETGADMRSLKLMEDGVISAFAEVCDGFSADRVVADPVYGAKFNEACQSRGLVGNLRDWNFFLFRLRKSGKLKSVATKCRTEQAWEAFDKISFGVEIALQQMLMPWEDGGCNAASLDEILCDPDLAAEFDLRAKRFAPLGENSLAYRWAALKLRKEAKNARTRAKLLQSGKFGPSIKLDDLDHRDFPAASGLFTIESPKTETTYYVGEALDLRSRIKSAFNRKSLEAWNSLEPKLAGKLRLSFWRTDGDIPLLLGYQRRIIDDRNSRFNFRELAAR